MSEVREQTQGGQWSIRISRAHKTALEALYTRYHTPVYSLAMFMLKQPTLVSMNTPRLVTYSPKSQFTR